MRYSTVVLIGMLTLLTVSCRKSELTLYNSPASVYFDLTDIQQDSLLYTFALTPEKASDTVYLPVKLEGIRSDKDRTFVLKVDPDSTTAVPGKHYKAIETSYIMTGKTGMFNVPVVLYNTDPLLQSQSVHIKFYLEATASLGVAMPKLAQARLVFSSKLEQPDWWSMWMYDYYSQVKHQLFIIVTGQTVLTTGSEGGMDAPKNLYFVSQLTTFLNNPAKWVNDHPDKGYVLEKIDDRTYHFYQKNTPEKVILYRYDDQTQRFFFIDENGDQVH